MLRHRIPWHKATATLPFQLFATDKLHNFFMLCKKMLTFVALGRISFFLNFPSLLTFGLEDQKLSFLTSWTGRSVVWFLLEEHRKYFSNLRGASLTYQESKAHAFLGFVCLCTSFKPQMEGLDPEKRPKLNGSCSNHS